MRIQRDTQGGFTLRNCTLMQGVQCNVFQAAAGTGGPHRGKATRCRANPTSVTSAVRESPPRRKGLSRAEAAQQKEIIRDTILLRLSAVPADEHLRTRKAWSREGASSGRHKKHFQARTCTLADFVRRLQTCAST